MFLAASFIFVFVGTAEAEKVQGAVYSANISGLEESHCSGFSGEKNDSRNQVVMRFSHNPKHKNQLFLPACFHVSTSAFTSDSCVK